MRGTLEEETLCVLLIMIYIIIQRPFIHFFDIIRFSYGIHSETWLSPSVKLKGGLLRIFVTKNCNPAIR